MAQTSPQRAPGPMRSPTLIYPYREIKGGKVRDLCQLPSEFKGLADVCPPVCPPSRAPLDLHLIGAPNPRDNCPFHACLTADLAGPPWDQHGRRPGGASGAPPAVVRIIIMVYIPPLRGSYREGSLLLSCTGRSYTCLWGGGFSHLADRIAYFKLGLQKCGGCCQVNKIGYNFGLKIAGPLCGPKPGEHENERSEEATVGR